MQSVKIIRDTSANKRQVFAGDVVPVSDHEARVLIGYGAAEPVESELKKARKPKTQQNEGD